MTLSNARARAVTLPGGTRKPVFSSITTSVSPPDAKATTGVSHSCASTATRLNPSSTDGIASTVAFADAIISTGYSKIRLSYGSIVGDSLIGFDVDHGGSGATEIHATGGQASVATLCAVSVNGILRLIGTDLSGTQTIASGADVVIRAQDFTLDTITGTKFGTAATQKLAFWGATPIVQPSGTGETSGFSAGSGTGVNDDSTFTGNVGSTAYRISDIVKALKQAGMLAQ